MSTFKSIFSNVKSKNQIFCIESSSATHRLLSYFKRHVIESITQLLTSKHSIKFNIICFNGNVAKWCVNSIPCTEDHIQSAKDWFQHIPAIGTCNFLGCIVSALRENVGLALCIIVLSEPDQGVDEILDVLEAVGDNAILHIRLFIFGNEISDEIEKAAEIYSYIIRELNRGTFAIVKFSEHSELVIYENDSNILLKDIHLYERPSLRSPKLIKLTDFQMVATGVHKNIKNQEIYPMCTYPYQHPTHKQFDYWKRITTNSAYMNCLSQIQQANESNMVNLNLNTIAASLIIGRRVLARNYEDGHFYKGFVKDQVQTNMFTVEFGPFEVPSREYVGLDYQPTKLLDIIDFDDAKRKSIIPGDRVLAADPNYVKNSKRNLRFIAGTVLEGYAARDYRVESKMNHSNQLNNPVESSKTLVIEFQSPINKSTRVPIDDVLFIPEPLFQRLVLESLMPKQARETLQQMTNYPEKSLPGYPTSGANKVPVDYVFTQPQAIKGRDLQVDYLMPPFCLPLYPITDLIYKDESTLKMTIKNEWMPNRTSSVMKGKSNAEEAKIPDSLYTVKELKLKIQDQLEAFKDQIGSEKLFQKKSRKEPSVKPSRIMNTTKSKEDPQYKMEKKASARFSMVGDMFEDSRQDKSEVSKHNRSYSFITDYQEELKQILNQTQKSELLPELPDSLFKRQSVLRKESEQSRQISFVKKPSESNFSNTQSTSINRDPTRYEIKDDNTNNVSNVAVVEIEDIGQDNKPNEAEEALKLQRRQSQVNRRLVLEAERFCNDERQKDSRLEYKRNTTAQRINEENEKRQSEYQQIDHIQNMKRQVNKQVEERVSQVEAVVPQSKSPPTYEEIDARRIANLRNARIRRDEEIKQRNECALKYIESLEEAKKNRADARWWEAQNKMLKETS